MNTLDVLGDLAPADDDASAVLGGGIPVRAQVPTPVIVGQSVTSEYDGPLVNGHANATV